MSSTPTPTPPESVWGRRIGGPVLLAAILVLIVGGILAFTYTGRTKPRPPDPDLGAAMVANTRGVALMEQFKYAEAAKEFEEASKHAPDWLPARINLGIALLNQDKPEPLAQARAIFAEILAKDPDNKHAHYCLGIIALSRGPFAEAYPHFVAVNKLDPEDPDTWLRLGSTHPAGTRSKEARECFEQALKRSPYMNSARYNLSQILFETEPERAKSLTAEFEALKNADVETESDIRYGAMGKYADVIGRDPSVGGKPKPGIVPMFESPADFKVSLAPGVRWATSADLDPLTRAARVRFGGTMILFDYNRDGRPDVFLLAAVVENGKVRDLLLRNDGNHAFTDVTAAAGLAAPRPSLGCAAGDFDNDGFPDLVITGAGEQHLFRNQGNGTFLDVSVAAGLDSIKGVCLGCGWLDLDQDGDLDLVLARFADSPAGAGSFGPDAAKPLGGMEVFENVGEALPGKPGLTAKFRRDDRLPKVVPPAAPVAFVVSDLDHDRDLDVLVLPDRESPVFVQNDRLMRFQRANPAWFSDKPRRWNGGLVLDANHDERSDLFLLATDEPPVYLRSQGERDFVSGETNSPPLRQAVTVDLDMDGWADVVGLTPDGKAILLHNQADGRLRFHPDAFGLADQLPQSAHAIACADLDGDGGPDLLLWSDAGLHLRRTTGNGNRAVLIDATGTRDKGTGARTNADGIGTWIVAQSGTQWTGAERTTTTAGLGQSLLPTALGIGARGQADALRFRWPDGVIQAELGINGGAMVRIPEVNRKTTSCPVLMTWDGERFAFVTDCLGAGSLGESGPDGSVRPPRPEESIKIEAGQLKPKEGQYLLKLAEPMDEVLYLDRVQLDVVDHPADTTVYPDERFVSSGPQPTQALLAFRKRYVPKSATDHRGRDVTPLVLHRDRRAVEGFALRSWLGYAEDHTLTLDFGEIPAGEPRRWVLVLAGWTEYPYPESIYAATRAGVELHEPLLERLAPDGKTWESLGELGFPAGLPRVMTRELPGFQPNGKCILRIRTNMQVYWDQVTLAPIEETAATVKVTSLPPVRATLANRGFMQEILPDGRPPVAYDDAKTELVAVTKWKGNLTRLGDVTELVREADDRFVLCGPGDEITVRFDATTLPALPPGWERSFVLRTWGYCKDNSPTTVTGGEIGPLPFRGMHNYPHFGSTPPPTTDAALWQTRPASGR